MLNQEIEEIMAMIESYGNLKHLSGYKKASYNYENNQALEKKYLALFKEASDKFEEIETKLNELINKLAS